MDKALEQEVRRRAAEKCEYCRLPASASSLPFSIDHISARQHGGDDSADNLALACGFCNRHKGPNLAGIDPKTGNLTRLFHPRKDRWKRHFRWESHRLVGLTPVGRTTVNVLGMNHPVQISVREALTEEGVIVPN